MTETANQLNKVLEDFLSLQTEGLRWDDKPMSEKWSKKEIIGHLIDSAQINLQRLVRCAYEENFKLVYQQDEWVAAQHYQQADIGELLDLWRMLNLQIIRVLKNYPVNRYGAKCDNSKTSENLQTVEWLANDYVEHLKHHLNQVATPVSDRS